MNCRAIRYWPLLLLLLPQVLRAEDEAVIYSAASSAPATSHPSASVSTTVAPASPTPVKPAFAVSSPAPVVSSVSAPAPAVPKVKPAPISSSAALPPSSGKNYIVKPGDNLYRIGKKNGTTLEAIKALNGLKNDTLRVGQTLTLPAAGYSYRPPQPVSPVQIVTLTTPSALPTPTPVPPSSVRPATTTTTTPVATASTTSPVTSPNSIVRIPYKPTYNEAQAKLMAESETLAKLDLGYDARWFPPGESKSWDMDCSNTSRYLYKKALGIELPRTASDQYYNLKIQSKAWDVPLDDKEKPDLAFLERYLRVGDLLFWENTYKPERDPPITHVTIFLGKDEKGRWIMAGSQSSSRGRYGNTRGGPDIYLFDPLKPTGGYSTWFGFVHKTGRFVAFGRPLAEAQNVASAR